MSNEYGGFSTDFLSLIVSKSMLRSKCELMVSNVESGHTIIGFACVNEFIICTLKFLDLVKKTVYI